MPRLPVPGGDSNAWGDILNAYLLREHTGDGAHNVRAILDTPVSIGQVIVSDPGAVKGLQWRALAKGDVGLADVDNTPDSGKSVSTLQQVALDAKQNRAGAIFAVAVPVLAPTVNTFVVWRAPFAAQLTGLRAYRVDGTGATVNARKNGTANHLAVDLSVSVLGAWIDGGPVQNAHYAAGDTLEVMFTAVTGGPSQLIVQLDVVTV
jgi:hypothetical protein